MTSRRHLYKPSLQTVCAHNAFSHFFVQHIIYDIHLFKKKVAQPMLILTSNSHSGKSVKLESAQKKKIAYQLQKIT